MNQHHAALKSLVDRLEIVHADPAYRAVWDGSNYLGRSYRAELDAAKAVLAANKKAKDPFISEENQGYATIAAISFSITIAITYFLCWLNHASNGWAVAPTNIFGTVIALCSTALGIGAVGVMIKIGGEDEDEEDGGKE